MLRMISVTSSLTPGIVENSCWFTVDRMRGHGRAGDARQQGAPQGVAEGVPETGLQRLDDEPRPVVGRRLFGEHGRCAMSMCAFLPATDRYLTVS
jgi:hypothetical protein